MWDSNIIREAKNAPVLAGFDRQRVLAFNQTISDLAVTLREIGKLTREGRPSPFETQDTERGSARETVCEVNRQRTMIRGGLEQTNEFDGEAWH